MRNSLDIQAEQIVVDLDKIDLGYIPEICIPDWSPTGEIAMFEHQLKIYLDIETTGLDANNARVIMIGLLVDGDQPIILSHLDEAELLRQFWDGIKQIKPKILIGHNLFGFDLPFLAKRSELLGIKHPLTRDEKERAITASSMNGQPIRFTPWRWRGVDIVDTFHQVSIWDKSASKLTGYGLKDSVITLGLRAERRLELTHQQINAAWESGDIKTIAEYLIFDLEDTQLLANFLLPVVWFQQKIVSGLSFQDLAVASPALKAQKIHQALGIPRAEADEPLKYEGALISCPNPGLHTNVAKIDVSSLYPSIMLRYGICSRKDPEHKFLGVMAYMTKERLRLKQLAKSGDKAADHQQNALKILINGSYGFMGTGGYAYNDFQAAALVTAYGRKIITLMQTVVEASGSTVIELDTDGILFTSTNPQQVADAVQAALPDGINIELEMQNCGAYVPKSKSYVIVHPTGKVTVKGLFRKRNNYPLANKFPVEFLKRYFRQSPDAATEYYHMVREQITNGTIGIEQLTITRKIAKSEKNLIRRGLGEIGDKVNFYYSVQQIYRKGKPITNEAIEITHGNYWVEYYTEKLDQQYNEITGGFTAADTDQMSLLDLF